jgi:hypothetical protein
VRVRIRTITHVAADGGHQLLVRIQTIVSRRRLALPLAPPSNRVAGEPDRSWAGDTSVE